MFLVSFNENTPEAGKKTGFLINTGHFFADFCTQK